MDTDGYEPVGTPSDNPAAASGRDRTGQAEAFDAIGDRYDEAFPHKDGQITAGSWLIAELPPAARVLDLGCGTGLPTARQFVEAGMRVTGVDLSAGMLARARSNVPEAEFVQADVADLVDGGPLTAGGFSAIAAFFTLLMLPRAEIPATLTAVRELLEPGGLLALGMVEADVDDVPIPFLGHTVRVSGYLKDELREIVVDSGFEVIKEMSYTYAPASTDVPPEEQIFLYCRRA
ncbi:class I SAM-dependent DNA methyltransferase [Streptomyces sp. NBC_00448]|uniref:class I SAM-dependent DNA methyltransferase n=1 Tax=Streptomyces sp. NBC_00448 TaxID=2903652 RepID=UPI003FA74EA5